MANTGDFVTNGNGVESGTRDALGNVIREVKKLNSTLLGDARERTDKVRTLVQKQGRAALSNLQHTVKERPALAVGIAVGSGLLLGMLLSGGRHSR